MELAILMTVPFNYQNYPFDGVGARKRWQLTGSVLKEIVYTTCLHEAANGELNVARPVTVNLPHQLGKDEAKQRIVDGFGRMRQQLTGGLGAMASFQDRWEGDRLHFEGSALGQKITGRLDVLADAVRVELDLPEILAAMADMITGRLQKEGQKLLEKK